jgi:catechol 2,3-dioxygenase-like lactoylglutathione lyase family enzyme
MSAERSSERRSVADVFNAALDSYSKGDLDTAIAGLRVGFFANLYVAPALLGDPVHPYEIWHPDPDAEPPAADDYASRYGQLWRDVEGALALLSDVWRDPVVRRELRSYVNLAKAILQAPDGAARTRYLNERGAFLDPRRIRGTQNEILGRLHRGGFPRPVRRPRLDSIHLAARDPAKTAAFYRDLFDFEPVRTSRRARGYVEFDLPGVRLAIHGHDRLAPGDPYRLGPPPASLGWGAVFVLRVEEFDRYYDNAERAGIDILDSDLLRRGERFFLVKDPSGYLIEIAE